MLGHNKGPGLITRAASGGLLGGNPLGPRTLNLVASEGISGNGMATIGLDNTFSILAHLPPPHTLNPYAPAVYAAYLVDKKGQNGFYAGTLRAVGNGMYQAYFRSPVPLIHYDKVVVSLESPQGITQVPRGPIVLKVKPGMLDSFGPVRKMGSDMWGRVKGFVGKRFGGKTPENLEQTPEAGQQGYTPQQGYAPQQGYTPQQGYIPQQSYTPQQASAMQYGYGQQRVYPRQSGFPYQGSLLRNQGYYGMQPQVAVPQPQVQAQPQPQSQPQTQTQTQGTVPEAQAGNETQAILPKTASEVQTTPQAAAETSQNFAIGQPDGAQD